MSEPSDDKKNEIILVGEEESTNTSSYSMEEDYYEEEEEEEYSDDNYDTWISNFCRNKTFRHWYCHVSDDFLFDNFNLFGLSEIFQYYNKALTILRDEYSDYDSDDGEMNDDKNKKPPEQNPQQSLTPNPHFSNDHFKTPDQVSQLEYETQYLYMLIHQRFIQSPEGFEHMERKIKRGVYGTCPRVACEKQHVLPFGLSTNIGVSGTMVYCPRCRDVYIPKNPNIRMMDGCAFGPNFATLFLSDINNDFEIKEVKNYPLEVFGFRLSETHRRLNREHPTMKLFSDDSSEYQSDNSYFEEEEEAK